MSLVRIRRFLKRLLPEEYRYRRRRARIRSGFQDRIDEAREEGEHDRARALKNQMHEQLHILASERQDKRSKELCREASRLNVPLPPRAQDDEETDYWTGSPVTGNRYLSREGMMELKKLIRDEKRWRMERQKHWAGVAGQVLSGVTGLVGAVIGLVAVL